MRIEVGGFYCTTYSGLQKQRIQIIVEHHLEELKVSLEIYGRLDFLVLKLFDNQEDMGSNMD